MCNIKLKKFNKIEKRKDKKIKIYVLGNPLLKEDSISLKLVPKLEKRFPQINFLEFDPLEELHSEEVIFMDVVEGIKNVEIINDLKILETRKIYSTHDFDLAFLLKLLRKLNIIKKAIIIGIPKNIKERDALKQLENKIEKLLLEIEMKEK